MLFQYLRELYRRRKTLRYFKLSLLSESSMVYSRRPSTCHLTIMDSNAKLDRSFQLYSNDQNSKSNALDENMLLPLKSQLVNVQFFRFTIC